jgi:hypothetical protein
MAMNTARLTTMIASTNVPSAPATPPKTATIMSASPSRTPATSDSNVESTSTSMPCWSNQAWRSWKMVGGFSTNAGSDWARLVNDSARPTTIRTAMNAISRIAGTITRITDSARGMCGRWRSRYPAKGEMMNASRPASANIRMRWK